MEILGIVLSERRQGWQITMIPVSYTHLDVYKRQTKAKTDWHFLLVQPNTPHAFKIQ